MILYSISKGQHSRVLESPLLSIQHRPFQIFSFPSGTQSQILAFSRTCGWWYTGSKTNAERVECCLPLATIHINSWWKQSRSISRLNYIIWWFATVSMLINGIIPIFTTRMVIYPHHWLCLHAMHCTMLSWSYKRTKVFIRKLPW